MVYRLTKHDHGLSVVFSAVLKNIDMVCEEVQGFLKTNELENILFDVLLGVREILTNAVLHGSLENVTKSVSFSIVRDNENLVIRAVDQGQGFDPRLISRQTAGEIETSGRGIEIIKIYFDSVKFNHVGNEIEIVKKISPKEEK